MVKNQGRLLQHEKRRVPVSSNPCPRMEKISWTDHVRNEEVLLRVKEQMNNLHEIRKRKANWIGHILRRNCLYSGLLKER
jgi:hypothetical protein